MKTMSTMTAGIIPNYLIKKKHRILIVEVRLYMAIYLYIPYKHDD